MTDRFVIAALVDRITAEAETTFEAGDARELARLLPREAKAGLVGRFLSVGVVAQVTGGSSAGHAAGIGDVSIKDDRPRTVSLSTADRGVFRCGQWKLRWSGRHIEINQVTDVVHARSAKLVFGAAGEPLKLTQIVYRGVFGSFTIGSYRLWKEPVGI